MQKKQKVKIFVAHHKPGYIYEDDVYVPIQVGKKNSKIDLGILGDDTGDNISEKNDNYAELTAQYWVWRNYDLSDVDYVGFCHYRRYMDLHFSYNINDIKATCAILRNWEGNMGIYNTFTKVFDYIFGFCRKIDYDVEYINQSSRNTKIYIENHENDIILPKGRIVIFSKESPLKQMELQDKQLWMMLEKIIIEKYPEYKSSLLRTQKYRRVNIGNIFIMKKNHFYEYCSWLFDILFEYENELMYNNLMTKGMSERITLGTRFLGCLSERLMNVYVCYKYREGCKISHKGNRIFFNV